MTEIYDAKTFQPSTGIGRLLGQVRAEIIEALDKEFEPFGITAAQYVILVRLADAETGPAARLCKGVSYDPGAMTRMIDRLEKKGLVRRVPCPDDRRKLNLELTAEGKAMYPKVVAGAVRVLNRFLRGFNKTEVRELEGLLRRMLANG
jgi:DNA-binding MarR family transcriptional regulator